MLPEGSDPKKIVVVAAVIEKDGTTLICKRPENKRHGGLWEFPGGKVEAPESIADAVRRELAEELELEVHGERHQQFTRSIGFPGRLLISPAHALVRQARGQW